MGDLTIHDDFLSYLNSPQIKDLESQVSSHENLEDFSEKLAGLRQSLEKLYHLSNAAVGIEQNIDEVAKQVSSCHADMKTFLLEENSPNIDRDLKFVKATARFYFAYESLMQRLLPDAASSSTSYVQNLFSTSK